MAQVNVKPIPDPTLVTHEGARAVRITHEQALKRSVMSCMLWEDSFYEDGVSIAERIASLVPRVNIQTVSKIAIDARTRMKLRHVPLLLAREMARHPDHKGAVTQMTIRNVIQRADEIAEFLAIYWKDGKQPLAASVKRGLADAFKNFNEYEFAKYDRDNVVKLRDVLFMVHGRTMDVVKLDASAGQSTIAPAISKSSYKRGKVVRHATALSTKIATRTLATPDTWEVKLSATGSTPEEKRASWVDLLNRKKLGALALLRNLRNMQQAGVPLDLIREALREMKVERVLPFRFLAAARYAPMLEPELEQAMFKCVAGAEKLKGPTVVLVDRSGSMDAKISGKSEMTRCDAAAGIAILLRELCDDVFVVSFDNTAELVPARRGFALRDAIGAPRGGTYTDAALAFAQSLPTNAARTIVVTDEQSHQSIRAPRTKYGYVINVGVDQHGIGYGEWVHVDGFSEATIDYIKEYEKAEAR